MEALQCLKNQYPSKSIQNAVQKIIKDEDYISCNIEVRKFDSEGGNFMGELFEIDIKGKTIEGDKETNIFVKKKIPLNKTVTISADAIYLNEVFMYNELSKVFTCLQDEANVPLSERYKMPKVYDVTSSEEIFIENLCKRNFKVYKRSDEIPLKYVELAVEEMAKLHGLSFVIENKMGEYFKEKIMPLTHILNYDDDWDAYMENICKYIISMYEDNHVVKEKIEKYYPSIFYKYRKYNTDQVTVKCTLTHGDYKMNNVLVREKDGVPVEVIPVDYQLIDYGCPIRDFLHLIFSMCDQEFRRKHLDNLKDTYYAALSRFLAYFDMDAETVYPRKEFDMVYREWLEYGLMLSIFGSAFFFASESGVDLRNIKLADMPINFNEHARSTIRGWIDDFIEWGII